MQRSSQPAARCQDKSALRTLLQIKPPGDFDVDQGHDPATPATLGMIESLSTRPCGCAKGTRPVRKLNVSLLTAREIDHAFPLIRTICPAAELEGWRRFAEQRLAAGPASGTGILIVRNEQDCIVGICAFRVAQDLLHGAILFADHFCALDIVDQGAVARALESGMEKIARRHACSAVHTTVTSGDSRDDSWLCAILHERGHRIEGLQMCKLIPTLA